MSKTDLDSAFRLLPVHHKDHNLLRFQLNDQFYYDCTLPIGASSSCSIFSRFSSSLQWLAQKKLGVRHMVHILDDFLFFGPAGSPLCNAHLDNFIFLCSTHGVPIKKEKTERATTCIIFMGLELDSETMEARLPSDKLSKLRSCLQSARLKRKIKLKDLQSLLGLLNFCCHVVIPGRTFLRRLYDLTKGVTNRHHRITLNNESRKDLQAWVIFADHFNGKHLLLDHKWISSPSLHLYTDAAGSIGYGAVFNTHWFHGEWPSHLMHYQITFKELFPIVLAVEIWGSHLRNKCITLHSDNFAVVHIINKQSSKDSDIMILVRRFVLACMRFNLLVRGAHIPGVLYTLPDLLSRSQIQAFHQAAGYMDSKPTEVPQHLLQMQ